MGVFLKQSFWTSFYSYVGIILGYLNSLIIFPAFLSPEQIGLYRQLQNAAFLVAPIALFGMSATTIKFFPKYSAAQYKKGQFFTFIILGTCFGIVITLALLQLFQSQVIGYFAEKSPSVNSYLYIIEILIVIVTFSSIFETFARAYLKIVIPTVLKDIAIRFLSGASILLYSINHISFHEVIIFLVVIYIIRLVALLLYSKSLDQVAISTDFNFLKKSSFKEIATFSFFSVIGSAGQVIVLSVDIVMVSGLLGLEATGVYTTAFYIGIVIEMPRRAISQISLPIISSAFTASNHQKVKELYKLISLNQMTFGILLYLGIISNIQELFFLIPNNKDYIPGIPIVFIIGFSKLVDMIFSCNSEIISMSKHYRFNFMMVLILAFVTIGLNQVLIPTYGIEGAAMASLGAILIFNFGKWLFIKIKLGFSPFSYENLKIGIVGLVIYIIASNIPVFTNAILAIIIRSALIILLFVGAFLIFKINKPLIKVVTEQVNRFLNR